MKVLMVARVVPQHGKGGMQDITWLMFNGLRKIGINVDLVTTSLDNPPDHVIALKNTSPGNRIGFWRKLQKMDLNSYDLIHSQSSAGFPLVFQREIPTLVSMHGTSYDEIKSSWNLKGLKSLPRISKIFSLGFVATDFPLLHLCTKVISTSDEQTKILKNTYKVSPSKIETIYNGMDFSLFKPTDLERKSSLKKELRIPTDKKIFLLVNRLVDDKNTSGVLDSLSKIPHDFFTIIVGGGPLEDELRKKAVDLGLTSKVRFESFVPFEKLPSYYQVADLFINFTKRQNGYDLTMLQALASEVPLIASAIGSHPTVIKNEKFGLLIPWEDPKHLTNALTSFLENKIHFDPKLARKETMEKFSTEKMIEAYENLYKRVCG